MKVKKMSPRSSLAVAKSAARRIAAAAPGREFAAPATQGPKGGGRFLIAGAAKAVKVHRNPRTGRSPRTGEPLKIALEPTAKFRRASANSDEVFATLANSFSSL